MHDPKGAGKDIFNVNFADYLPDVLKNDTKMRAFADVVTRQMLEVSQHIDDVLIYSRLDKLPEPLIDILAYDMHIDWYDYSFPLEIKRSILKNSVKVHKKTGTKYAVETVLKSIHKGARVQEWFEYGGSPYFFRVDIDIGDIGLSEVSIHELASELQAYKNIRSHCEKIKYNLFSEKADVKAGAFSKHGERLKVKAVLADCIKCNPCESIKAYPKCGEKLKVKAVLTDRIKCNPCENIKAYQRGSQTITVKKRG